MAPRTPTALGRTLLSGPCSCRAPSRVHLARLQSSAAATDAQSAPSTPPTSSHRVVASALLSRPPLILPPLSPLERSYYSYQRRIHRALAKPTSVSQQWFFKKGTQAEKSFVEFEKRVAKEEEQGDLEQLRAFEMAAEEVEGAPDFAVRETETDKKGDVTSLERKADRTLYLLLKKDRREHAWQFPQGGVEGEESLIEAAKRELHEETGVNVDVWPSGRVPAGAYTYAFSAEHKKKHPEHEGAKVFFMPMRIIRGQVEPNKQEGIVDFAWLTKEEVKEKVSPEYWAAIEPMLSDY
ncbi:hypothetical protein JCM10295v2_007225 [Rhodotorula toruloides]